MPLISVTRMGFVMRVRSSRRGERSKAIYPSEKSSTVYRPRSAVLARTAVGRWKTGDALRGLLLRGRGGAKCLRHDFLLRRRDEGLYFRRSQISRRAAPHRHVSLRGLPIPGDQHVRHLLQLGLTDLIANLLLAIVELYAKPGGCQPVAHAAGVFEVAVRDRQQDCLHGC